MWSSCEILNGENKSCLWLWCLFLEPITPTGLPHSALREEKEPSLIVLDLHCLADIHAPIYVTTIDQQLRSW